MDVQEMTINEVVRTLIEYEKGRSGRDPFGRPVVEVWVNRFCLALLQAVNQGGIFDDREGGRWLSLGELGCCRVSWHNSRGDTWDILITHNIKLGGEDGL